MNHPEYGEYDRGNTNMVEPGFELRLTVEDDGHTYDLGQLGESFILEDAFDMVTDNMTHEPDFDFDGFFEWTRPGEFTVSRLNEMAATDHVLADVWHDDRESLAYDASEGVDINELSDNAVFRVERVRER